MTTNNFNTAALRTPKGVEQLMGGSKNEREWDNNADAIKAANRGYPSFWWPVVMQSGLAAKTVAKFKP